MLHRNSLRATLLIFAAVAGTASVPAHAGVTGVAGQATTQVTQFLGPVPVQSDFGLEIIPLTKSEPPLLARARVDRLINPEEVSAAGQGLAVLFAPNLSGIGNPSDIGIDVGAFTDDTDLLTNWVSSASVQSKRTLVLTPGEIGQQPGIGSGRARSRVLLSGIMMLTSSNPARDMSNAEVALALNLIRTQDGRAPQTVLAGEVALVGGPNGAITVERRTGVFANIVLPVIDFGQAVPDTPLVRAILFTGVDLPFEYDMTLNQPFNLDLSVTASVKTTPAGVGGLAVFGTPQEGLTAIFNRIKKDDRGAKLAEAIAARVDTTGQLYVQNPNPFALLLPSCGAMTAVPLAMTCAGFAALVGVRRRSRCRSRSNKPM